MLFTEREGDCLVWTGPRDKDGYARARLNGQPAIRLTHVVWLLAHGTPVPEGHLVRHRCDNPPCLDPRHLLTGTVADNSADMTARGRQSQGEKHHATRLTATEVRELYRRSRAGESVVHLAREFNVRPWSVQKIRDGVTWKSITTQLEGTK